MREILFRGQHRCKGEKVRLDGTPVESKWVYGGYCQYNKDRGIIYQSEPEINKYSVYADTVGQYTGLTDKNGTKIFEGDILEWHCNNPEDELENHPPARTVVKYGEYPDIFDNKHLGYYVECQEGFGELLDLLNTCIQEDCNMTVVGNIYDNPELLRVKNG